MQRERVSEIRNRAWFMLREQKTQHTRPSWSESVTGFLSYHGPIVPHRDRYHEELGSNCSYIGLVAKTSPSANLVDTFGRVARDLRVSLTDRCNLRCTYCMPAEGMEWLPTQKVLSDTEISRLLGIAVRDLGITKIRFTGGEPLLRKGLEDIVGAASQLRTADGQRPELTLTTNALGLEHRAEKLAAAGLDRVNISLDSLDKERYAKLARRDRLPDVLAGIDAAAAAGLVPVKINAVIMPDTNEAGNLPPARWTPAGGEPRSWTQDMPEGAGEAGVGRQ